MSWSRRTSTWRGLSAHASVWSPEEVDTLARAVNRAPSVHNTQPWTLSVHDRAATLSLRSDAVVEHHDPQRHDLFVSCGAALTNLVLAVRHTGRSAEVQWCDDPRLPDELATVLGVRRVPPTATESRRYNAIPRRTSHRQEFTDVPLQHLHREALFAAAGSTGVEAMWVAGTRNSAELANRLNYGAKVHRANRDYQRELSAWTFSARDARDRDVDSGIPVETLEARGVAALGLTTSSTRIPDPERLAAHIRDESVLLLAVESEHAYDEVRLGQALQMCWLAATSMGVAASVMTQPLALAEVRRGLAEALGLQGIPRILVRFGYPASVPDQRSPRRALPRIFGATEEHATD